MTVSMEINDKLKNNDSKDRLILMEEWSYPKNDSLLIHANEISDGSNKKIWWDCLKCNSHYSMSMKDRLRKRGCPYCSGQKVNHTNSLAVKNPDIALEWNTLRNPTSADETHYNSTKKAWWTGKCGHEWESSIRERSGDRKSECPYCTSRKILIGFNDLWTTNPDLASLLVNSEDGYKYMQFSNKCVDWRCQSCKKILKNKKIADMNLRGFKCPICSDGIPYGEKFVYTLLKESNVNFQYDRRQEWSGIYRYDFFLPELSLIIEVHGGQHYGTGFESAGGRTLAEEQTNDKNKEYLARANGVKNYVIIDARVTSYKYIVNSIENSNLKSIFPDIDYLKIGRASGKSLIETATNLWNSGIRNASHISKEIGVNNSTASRYLLLSSELGWCDYATSKHVVQLDLNLNRIKDWTASKEIIDYFGISSGYFSRIIKDQLTYDDCIWMFKADYEKLN